METLFVFLNVQLLIFLRIGNLQMLLEIELLKRKKKRQKNKNKNKSKEKSKKKKKIKIALSLGNPSSYFYNKRCKYVALMAIFIIFLII